MIREIDPYSLGFDYPSALCGVKDNWYYPEYISEDTRSGRGPGVSLCDKCLGIAKSISPAEVEP